MEVEKGRGWDEVHMGAVAVVRMRGDVVSL